jgi:putative transposase
MVRYRRNFLPGGTFFFTVALGDRRSTLLTDHISILRQAFRKTRAERPFDIDAIVILPDHLHAILTLPESDADFPQRWRRIKTIFTQRVLYHDDTIPPRDHTGRALWQRRFWEHTITDESDFARHVDYIHINPVKHGLVSNPSDWPHSSLHRFIRKGIVAPSWAYGEVGDDGPGEPNNTLRR